MSAENIFKTIVSDAYKLLKGLIFYCGVFMLLVLLIVVVDIKTPDWAHSDLIDDVLYFAYDYEKFGFWALLWRWFVIVAIFKGIIDILGALYSGINERPSIRKNA